MAGIYDKDGKIILTEVDGTDFVGVYHENGTFNAVDQTNNSDYVGVYHPSGAFNVVVNSDTIKAYAPNGALNVRAVGDGTFRPIDGQNSYGWSNFISGLTIDQAFLLDFKKTDTTFQSVTGTPVADDPGEVIALALDRATWNNQTLTQFMATQPELKGNGTIGMFGTATPATYNTSTGVGGVSRTAYPTDQSYVSFPVTAGVYYQLDLESPSAFPLNIRPNASAAIVAIIGQGRVVYHLTSSTSEIIITCGVNGGPVPFTVHSLKRIPGYVATQATTASQPSRQAGGVSRYDGSADNLLTTFTAQSGAMTLLYHGTVPATLAAVQVLMGSSGNSANRCWLGVDTSGHLCAGVGSDTESTIKGTTDVRGKTIVAALVFNGTTVQLFLYVDGEVTQEYSGAQSSTPTTTIPFRLGALNNNGTAGSFAAIDAHSFRAAKKAMTLNQFKALVYTL